ncbi:hypothetical protein BY996DRAFT_2443628 [Phakopsora pachyrhizi]|nr:hypothetical protein BY996DRAFT_2443628 [Phakopsora pachyrhizi]
MRGGSDRTGGEHHRLVDLSEDSSPSKKLSQLRLSQEFYRREGLNVLLGSLSSGIGGMTFGSLIAIKNNEPFALPAISMSLKSFGFGTTLRQFLVRPIVAQYSNPTTKNIHFEGIFSTFISAGILGGSINGYLRGKSYILRSSFTVALMCSSLHFLKNELTLLKDSFSANSQGDSPISDDTQRAKNPSSGTSPFWEYLIPLKKLSDEDFRLRLKEQLIEAESKRKIIDNEISRFEKAIRDHDLSETQADRSFSDSEDLRKT